MQKAGDDGLSYIEGDLTVTAGGTLAVDQGTLELEYGTDILSGLITGPGALLIGYGASAALGAGAVLNVASLNLSGGSLALGGSVTYDGSFLLDGALEAGGNTLTLTGPGTLEGAVTGGGAVILTGAAQIGVLSLSGNAPTLIDTGTVWQIGTVSASPAGSSDAMRPGRPGTSWPMSATTLTTTR